MYWLYLLLALGCFAFALKTPNMGLMSLALLGTLAFLLAWVRGRYAARFGDLQRDPATLVDSDELRRLREQAKVAPADGSDAPSHSP
ncbi:hypothetical protein K5K93_12615 [Stenotrophomonas sp. DR822]|uniref:hypothetical protein n=1 Tax=Stenotrophomonas TaxID=40323 RepID=UPI0008C39083|nr:MULTISPECIES: hypothetical protein [Stenotrophomonas]QZN79464.1 hypothetical protein K5K93_12615 [Stenotrophomonas sp. DR822]SET95668.1 hypothetical protein SAMN05720615_110110 [Stenotrophomonas indicatrix]